MKYYLPLLAVLAFSSGISAADWPQWMGPTRDGVWNEEGISARFPEGGPKKLWSMPVGGGYSGPAVVGSRVFAMDFITENAGIENNPNKRNEVQGIERIHCLDAATGKSLWKHEYSCHYSLSFPCGPRCTPTVDGDRVYTLGAMGHLRCLDAKSGEVVWSKDFPKDYKAPVPQWGFCGHPLIHKDLLICLVGGEGHLAVAFDKLTGKEVWKTLGGKDSGYCPPSMIRVGDSSVLLLRCPKAIHALNPSTGEPLWLYSHEPRHGLSLSAPLLHKNILYTGGGGVSVALKLAMGTAEKPAELWKGTADTGFSPSNATPLISDGTIYGCDSATGAFGAVDLATGKRLWETRALLTDKDETLMHGTAFAVKNGERCFLFTETGHLIVAKLTPEKYEELDRAKLIEPTGEAFGRKVVWSHPAFADKKIFVRNDKEIAAFDLAK